MLSASKQIAFPITAREGLQPYSESVSARYELMDRIVQAVLDGNEYEARQCVRKRNQIKIAGRLKNELTEWKYDLIQGEALIIYALRRAGVSELSLDSIRTEYTQKINDAFSIEMCQQLWEEMVHRMCDWNQDLPEQEYSILVQKIMLAIDMDLSQNLTLQYFSETLNVNDSYLSNLFSKEVGMPLTDYVTERRISRASELLLTTKHPIKIVAKMVGITDVHYFSRVFKRKMGKPPSHYREERG
jgi:YesN/AraC family two-component response regulator